MAHAPVLRALWAGLSLLAAGVARPDVLASFTESGTAIALRTEPCGPRDSELQRAVKRVGPMGFDGCWTINRKGNPVILWNDGTVQELDESRLTLAPRYMALLKQMELELPRQDQQLSTGGFSRAFWCKDASFPHERLICRDPELAKADLALSPLWRAYRQEMRLDGVEERRVKRDYFRRLKACGAKKSCIAREQAAQEQLYRRALRQR